MDFKKAVLKQKQHHGQKHFGNLQIRLMLKIGSILEEFEYESTRII
jgi:hypothetical protein